MTEEQKAAAIALFNAAFGDELMAEEGMDNAQKERTWSKYANDHSFALGRQSAIDAMLNILGYSLIRCDEGYAEDIRSSD